MDFKEQIDKNAHYFILTHPLEVCVTQYGPIVYTSNMIREKWVECEIVEDRYKLSDGYKVDLKSVEEGYGKETYYIEDFLSHLEKGFAFKKEKDMCCVEEEWITPLTNNTYLHHSAYTLKMTKRGE